MIEVRGPGASFTTLFDEQDAIGLTLPPEFAQIYSSWPLPEPRDRPFVFSNFVMSHDGRVSFNTPGHMGGGDVSRRDTHDRWLMGLLRSRCDAVIVGGSSIEAAGNHVWTPQAVFREDAAAFAALRLHEKRAAAPLLVVLTRSGNVPAHAPSLDDPNLPVLIATTTKGVRRTFKKFADRDWIRRLSVGEELDNRAVLRSLFQDFGARHVLCEAGPQVYGALLKDGLIDDAFVTISPIMMGETDDQRRPSLIEGVAFRYADPPRLRLLSAHRHGSYLYLHSRYERSPAASPSTIA